MHLGAFTSWQSAVETRPVNASPASRAPIFTNLSLHTYEVRVRLRAGVVQAQKPIIARGQSNSPASCSASREEEHNREANACGKRERQ